MNIGEICKLIHEINLRVQIIVHNAVQIQIQLKFRHFQFFFLWNEPVGIDLKPRFRVRSELLVLDDLVLLNLLKLFFLVFLLDLYSVRNNLIFAVWVYVGIKNNQRVDILQVVRDTAEGLDFALGRVQRALEGSPFFTL